MLGEADLEFDDDELSQIHQNGATEEQAAELLAQTGAWPAGVRLVALARAEPLASNGTANPHTSVDDYLLKQVLADFSRDELEFFAYVALMSPASVALLNEVLGRNDTLEILRDFQRRGTPMIRLPATS